MNLPSDFTHDICALLGKEAYDSLARALGEVQPVSIRLNDKIKDFEADDVEGRVPWCESGRYLNNRPSFTFDPLFHAGAYYVQEASSMFLEQAIKQYVSEPVVALDLCAAPGGKSTHLRSILPQGSLLVSNEILRSRAQILAENMIKWGNPDILVTNNAPSDFAKLRHSFDVLVTDMPCSGEGMFRKDEKAITEWSRGNVEMCSRRQREIIESCWQCLKPGGLLIYSTCTFNTLENEENIEWICKELDAEVLPVEVGEWHITGNLLLGAEFPVYRFLPGKTRGEGFFLAVMRKAGEGNVRFKVKKEDKKHLPPIQGIRDLMIQANSWMIENEKYRLATDGKEITALNKSFTDVVDKLSKILHIMQKGVTIGEIKGHNLIPAQSLAMSKILRRDAFPQQELTFDEAITYLRKDTLILHQETPHGCVLLTYHQAPLGFVKNMGNRTNNLYPQEWRIRSGYVPHND